MPAISKRQDLELALAALAAHKQSDSQREIY